MRTINQATLIRYLSVMNKGEIDFFLGSGASAQAGIPTGGTMIWDFKRELYCTENSVSKDLFKDLYAEITRKTLQNYFDSQGGHPSLWAPEEYAHYFELCHPTSIARERYIQSKVNDISPSIGHLCLGDLFIKKKVVNVWTTNFDELVEAGIKTLAPHHSFNVYSSANKSVAPSNALSSVIKLHGDYRYDHIKNTPTELQSLEASMQKAFSESLVDKGLVVVGYSGSDESIMSTFEAGMSNSDFLKYGLIWTIPEGVQLSVRLSALMEKVCQANENSGIVQIQDFDKFMYSIYAAQIAKNDAIENLWEDYAHRKLPISFQIAPTTNFTKLNAFESTSSPSCMVFDTDISSWKQLKEVIGNSGIIAALYARRVYCFDETDEINRVFDSHVKSLIEQERVRSIDYYDQCKVMWGLSTSLYAKAAGVLWQPVTMNKETAFVGVSYAISKSKGTCIGCSQLFDSTGTGIRLLLRKIDDPGFWGRNPYMKSDEARSMMSALRDQYYKCDPTNQLKRIVVHKTTPFTQEEIKGFTQALEGIDDIELLQIQEYASWRAIRYDTTDFKSDPALFAIHRGTAIPLNDDCFLLWTHGCIQHNDLSGSGYNYYKGGRGIPSPLLVKRFYGKASGDVLVNEILMLSKMNWNSGDSLYKQLPVTLDFAKVLSRMSKQDEAIYNMAYDFRYFM